MINAAIIGLGRWGQNLVNSVQGKSRSIRFVAGAVRTPSRVQGYADSRGIRLYDDYRKLLADPQVDAVVLATPHSLHAELIMAAARAGKHVFTEKPFTLTTASAKEAVRTCARRGVTLAVGYNWRFQPALQEIRRMLDDGRLGKLLHVEGNFCGPSVYWYPKDHWRQKTDEGPGGGMTGRGVHVVDAMLYLAGQVDTVYAQSFRRALNYGIDDTTSMLFRFKEGASGYLGTFIATAETWRMQVFGSKGWVEVGDVEHLGTWQMKVCLLNPDDLRERRRPEIVTFPDTSTERAELEHFAQAVERRQPLAITGGDEIHGVTVLESILESVRTGSPVKVGRNSKPSRKAATRPAKRGIAPGKKKAAKKK
jgi:predicted dehydrogenase